MTYNQRRQRSSLTLRRWRLETLNRGIELRNMKIVILSALLLMTPHVSYASYPTGAFDVLWSIFIVILSWVVIPITLVGLALRKKPTELSDKSVIQVSSKSTETPDTTDLQETTKEEIKNTDAPQHKPKISLIRCIVIILAVMIAIGPFIPDDMVILKFPYTTLFLIILYGFPILIPVALLSLFLAARRRSYNSK